MADDATSQHSGDGEEVAAGTRGEAMCLLAVPKKGRLFDKVTELLKGVGINYNRQARLDIAYCENLPLKLVFLPAADIAQFVAEGNVDLGLTGQDMVAEADVSVNELTRTGFGKCSLALLAPVSSKITDPSELIGKRVATSFPLMTRRFFDQLDPSRAGQTKIRDISGSVEAACALGLADAVVDLWETGTTAKAAGLEIVATVLKTECVLIANPNSPYENIATMLRRRIDGYILAKANAMIYYNIPKDKLAAASKITPGKKNPTITPLSDDSWLSVGAMVLTKEINNIMDQLHEIGATDIFVVDLINCRA